MVSDASEREHWPGMMRDSWWHSLFYWNLGGSCSIFDARTQTSLKVGRLLFNNGIVSGNNLTIYGRLDPDGRGARSRV
jgi:hypothetical protein